MADFVRNSWKASFYILKLEGNLQNISSFELLMIFIEKVEILTAKCIYDDASNTDATQLVSKYVFLVLKQLPKRVWQIV